MDFDGDGVTDIAVYDGAPWTFPIEQTYFQYRSSITGQIVTVQWGLTTDSSAVADYDGDGKADPSIHRWQDVSFPSTLYNAWWIKGSLLGDYARNFGPVGVNELDLLPGDYDGDGKAEPAFTHQTCDLGDPNNTDDDFCQFFYTYAQPPNDESFVSQVTGYYYNYTVYGGGLAAAGDYDGDGTSDVVVYDPQIQQFKVYARPYSPTTQNIQRYVPLDIDLPTPGDFNRDGRTDFAGVKNFQSQTLQPLIWKVRYNLRNGLVVGFDVAWGMSNEYPVPGDYDGDQKTDLAVYNKQTSTWTIRRSSDMQTWTVVLGDSNDTPVTFPTQNPRCFNPMPGSQCTP
ncbi:MAG: VCBS repeat-containing protein [Pyrinomonadaceae bacterium]